ncbi:MAG: hypothetical protein V1921_01900 [Candidatus Altiarchaeota archaeon]
MKKTNICLVAGILLLASYVSAQTLISTALSSINGQYILVYAYNASASPAWVSYNPYALSPGSNSLNYTSVQWGYWVKVNASSATLNVTGTQPSSTAIGLVSGWNLIGYPKTTTQLLSTTLSGINGQYILVYGYNASASPAWVSYNPYALSPGSNSLNYSIAGYGYWVKVNASSATLTVT